jgi:hypothetical protein
MFIVFPIIWIFETFNINILTMLIISIFTSLLVTVGLSSNLVNKLILPFTNLNKMSFLFQKRFALIAIFILSSFFIVGTWSLALKMTIYGILDIVKFQTPGSCIRLAFGLIVFSSSFPFILIIANLNNKKIRQQ